MRKPVAIFERGTHQKNFERKKVPPRQKARFLEFRDRKGVRTVLSQKADVRGHGEERISIAEKKGAVKGGGATKDVGPSSNDT